MDSKAMINRRTAIGAALVGASPLLFPGRVRAQGKAKPADSFVVLLKGIYQPVVNGPNLGLSTVDLSDGSYSTTKIYPVCGTPGNTNLDTAIGDFYVKFTVGTCVRTTSPEAHLRCGSQGASDNFPSPTERAGVPHRNLRARRHRGDGDLSIHCGRPQPHGRHTALFVWRQWGHRRTLLLHRQRPITPVETRYHGKARSGGPSALTGRGRAPAEGVLVLSPLVLSAALFEPIKLRR